MGADATDCEKLESPCRNSVLHRGEVDKTKCSAFLCQRCCAFCVSEGFQSFLRYRLTLRRACLTVFVFVEIGGCCYHRSVNRLGIRQRCLLFDVSEGWHTGEGIGEGLWGILERIYFMGLYPSVHCSIGFLVPSFQEFFGNNIVLPISQHLRRSQTQ